MIRDHGRLKHPAWFKRRLETGGDIRDEAGKTLSYLIPHYSAWTLLVWTVISGLLLVIRYRPPTALQAQQISEAVLKGGGVFEILAEFHRWAAFLLVMSILLHLLLIWIKRGYRFPRDINWTAGIILLALTWILAGSGFLLRWDAKSLALVQLAFGNLTGVEAIDEAALHIFFGSGKAGEISLVAIGALHYLILPLMLLPAAVFHRKLAIVQRPMEAGATSSRLSSRRSVMLSVAAGTFILLSLIIWLGADDQISEATFISLLPDPGWLWLMNLLPAWLVPASAGWLTTAIFTASIIILMAVVPLLRGVFKNPWVLSILLGTGVILILANLGGGLLLANEIPYRGCHVCHRPTMVGRAATDYAVLDSGDPIWLRFHLTQPVRSILTPNE